MGDEGTQGGARIHTVYGREGYRYYRTVTMRSISRDVALPLLTPLTKNKFICFCLSQYTITNCKAFATQEFNTYQFSHYNSPISDRIIT